MKGFNEKFRSFPQYILDITHEIWEEKKVETLNEYYSDDIIVRSPSGIVIGNQKVIEQTYQTLNEFPDRQLLGEDVIWCGSPEKGMLSSHRIMSTATHTGNGNFGEATGKKLKYRVIADCHAINNQINDEWLIRDLGAIVRQLGEKPKEYTRKMIEQEGGFQKCSESFTPEIDVKGPYVGKGNENKWGEKLSNVLKEIINGNSNVIEKEYDRAANLFYPGGGEDVGYHGANEFWNGIKESFPNAKLNINHAIGMEEDNMPPRAAVRWAINGKHEGNGMFGKASNAQVHIMGITHMEFGQQKMRREYTLFDEIAVWKQIIMKIGE